MAKYTRFTLVLFTVMIIWATLSFMFFGNIVNRGGGKDMHLHNSHHGGSDAHGKHANKAEQGATHKDREGSKPQDFSPKPASPDQTASDASSPIHVTRENKRTVPKPPDILAELLRQSAETVAKLEQLKKTGSAHMVKIEDEKNRVEEQQRKKKDAESNNEDSKNMKMIVDTSRHAVPKVTMLDVTVVIHVTSAVSLTDCLRTLYSIKDEIPKEIIAIFSHDLSENIQELPNMKLLTLSDDFSIESAYNHAAAYAFTEYIVFISDVVTPRSGWLKTLHNVMQEPQPASPKDQTAAVGGKIICEKAEEDLKHKIWSAGVDYSFDLEMSFTRANTSEILSHIALPYNLRNGFPSDYADANVRRNLRGISPHYFMTRRSMFTALGGFNEHTHHMHLNTYTMKLFAYQKGNIVYEPKAELETRQCTKDSYEFKAPEVTGNDMLELWVDFGKQLKNRYRTDMNVVWDVNTCGCTGFWSEFTNFIVPLEDQVPLKVVYTKDCFCNHSPPQVLNRVERMIFKDKNVGMPVNVFISHKKPDEFAQFPYRGIANFGKRPDYVIGRPLTETVPIPEHYVYPCNRDIVDEIWLPSQFHVDAFADSGVDRSKLVVIGESVDVHFFDPQTTIPMSNLPEQKLKNFKFLSTFKWEGRKGWDILLKAFYEEFTADDDVALYIQTYIPDDPTRSPFKIWDVIDAWKKKKLQLDDKENKLPTVHLITHELTAEEVPRLFKTVNAFVLPTRGEGWGMPIMEAMAMGLPTIATKWGGNLEFMNDDNSYLLDIEGLSEANQDVFHGSLWAEPSVGHLKKLMRYLYTNQDAAARMGRKARKYIVENFSMERLTEQVVDRLKIVEEKIKAQPKQKLYEHDKLKEFFKDKYQAKTTH